MMGMLPDARDKRAEALTNIDGILEQSQAPHKLQGWLQMNETGVQVELLGSHALLLSIDLSVSVS